MTVKNFCPSYFNHLILLLAFSIGTTHASDLIEHPPLKLGDTWSFQYHNRGDKKNPYEYINTVTALSSGSAWIYGESKEENARFAKYVWRYDLKRASYIERFSYEPNSPNQAGERNLSRLKNDDLIRWPLKVGDNFKARIHSGSGYTDWDIKIEAFEKITVPAGTFDAFRIKRDGYWYNTNSGNTGRAEATGWFSPDVKANIKTVYKDWTQSNRPWNDDETVLIKWTPAGQ